VSGDEGREGRVWVGVCCESACGAVCTDIALRIGGMIDGKCGVSIELRMRRRSKYKRQFLLPTKAMKPRNALYSAQVAIM